MTSTEAGGTPPPTHIGPYRILEEIGRGGMGTVYRAERRGDIRQEVAIKVVTAGMATDEVLKRFDLERRALAAMSHKNIARVFDAGSTEQGAPFFAMEYVQGSPLTIYCDQHKLSVADRCKLFQQVCAGVQHAHQKGVVHRDLKPGNVLVAREGEDATVKILDFGLAKATDRDFLEETFFTARDRVLGTPEYMAPEQAVGGGELLDSRADVYSLGVMLYELLSGELPFTTEQLKAAGQMEALRLIRDVEPPKPSTRLRSRRDSQALATQRRSSTAALTRALQGDLDWVIVKAMSKEPERRYDSATGLAMDLQRYLDNEPVLAGPPSFGYRLKKYWARNKLSVSAAAAVLTATLAGAGLALVSAAEAREQKEIAEGRAETITKKNVELEASYQQIATEQARFAQLSAVDRLKRLRAELHTFQPTSPEEWPAVAARITPWITRAERLVQDVDGVAATLEELRQLAASETDTERQQRIENHPRAQDLARLQQRLEATQRARTVALSVAAGNPSLDLPGNPQDLLEFIPAMDRAALGTALELAAYGARRVQALDVELPRPRIFGQELAGCAALKLALLRVDEGDRSQDRASVLLMLTMGYLAVGRTDLALSTAGAMQEAAPDTEEMEYKATERRCEELLLDPTVPASSVGQAARELTELRTTIENDRDYVLPAAEDQFLHDALTEALPDLRGFGPAYLAEARMRREWGQAVVQMTVESHAGLWAEARTAILKADGVVASERYGASHSEYHPIDLQPQVGLIPIGMNPTTKLWEFVHLRSAWSPRNSATDKDNPISQAAEIPLPAFMPQRGASPSQPSTGVPADWIDVLDYQEYSNTPEALQGCGTGIVFVLIPGGTFAMGSPASEAGRKQEEARHEVSLAPYFLARHELSQGQWARLLGHRSVFGGTALGEAGPTPSRYTPGMYVEAMAAPVDHSHPVERVSWQMATMALGLNGLVLPTEAQWERGARGNTTTPYSFGASPVDARPDASGLAAVNLLDQRAAPYLPGDPLPFDDGFLVHAPVDALRANPFGLHHVHGNVSEWCRDIYADYSVGHAPRTGELLTDSRQLDDKILRAERPHRGGSLDFGARFARSAFRDNLLSTYVGNALGVRAARRLSR